MNRRKDVEYVDLKVLVLEDSLSDVELMRVQLIHSGFRLELTHVENEAGYTAALRENFFDLILADFKLPDFDALRALEISRELCPETPFICASGSIGEETAVELLKLGAADYVLKDRPEKLSMAVKRALEEAKVKAEYQQTADALRESEEKYRTLVNSALQGVVIVQANPVRLVFANPAMTQITGYSRESLIGMGPDELGKLIYKADRQRFFGNFQKRIQGENIPQTNEYRLKTKDGTIKWAALYSSRIIYLNEPATLTSFMDITERKQAKEALKTKINEMECFHKLTIGREFAMIELKKEVNELLEKAGKPAKYKIVQHTEE
jgi:PAS domain S-box-containing protein